jgi:transcriptional regulator with XRE-family HTH domain
MAGTWKSRLEQAIKDDGRSMRALSLEAELGPNYLSEVFREGKEPGVEKMMKVCDVLKVSFTHIVTGVDLDQDDEDFLRLLSDLEAEDRSALVALARKLQKPAPPSK